MPDVIKRHASGRPSLVFCASRKSTELLAAKLSSMRFVNGQARAQLLAQASERVATSPLKNLIRAGVAYHNAAVPPEDRDIIEQLFGQEALAVLCCTTTLAMGVNLPAHLCVIKGTQIWQPAQKRYAEMPAANVQQMIGRAGRPGFDTSGVAVIMTSSAHANYWRNVSSGLEVIESQLLGNLIEVLVSEAAHHVVNDVAEAIRFLKSTFLFVRLTRNPTNYGMPADCSSADLDARLKSRVLEALGALAKANILGLDDDGFGIEVRAAAPIMSKYIVRFPSMQRLMQQPATIGVAGLPTVSEQLDLLCQCDELQSDVRRGQKSILNELNKKSARFGIKGKIQTPEQKVSVLLQAAMSDNSGKLSVPEDFTLRNESRQFLDVARRLLLAREDFAVEIGQVPLAASLLLRSLRLGMWENTALPLRQFEGIGPVNAQRLADAGIRTLQDVLDRGAGEIDTIAVSRCGASLQSQARTAIQSAVTIEAVETEPTGAGSTLKVRLGRQGNGIAAAAARTENVRTIHGAAYDLLTVWMETPSATVSPLLLFRNLLKTPGPEFTCPLPRNVRRVYVSVLSRWIGLDSFKTVELTGARSPDTVSSAAAGSAAAGSAGGTSSDASDTTKSDAPRKRQKTIEETLAANSQAASRSQQRVAAPASAKSSIPASTATKAPPSASSLPASAAREHIVQSTPVDRADLALAGRAKTPFASSKAPERSALRGVALDNERPPIQRQAKEARPRTATQPAAAEAENASPEICDVTGSSAKPDPTNQLIRSKMREVQRASSLAVSTISARRRLPVSAQAPETLQYDSTQEGTVGAPTRPSVAERLVDRVSPMPSIESFAFEQAEPPDDHRHQRWQQAQEWQHEQWRRQEERRQRVSYQHQYPPVPQTHHPMPPTAPMHPTSHAAMAPMHAAQPNNKNISFDEAFFD